MTGAKFNFSNLDEFKRNREIEGTVGVHVKYSDDIYLHVLAMSDANPRWTKKAKDGFAELNRLENIGASEAERNRRFAQLLTDTIVLGWHGGVNDDGTFKPGGPRDQDGRFVPFTPEACVEFLIESDDIVEDLLKRCRETRNFRVQRAKAIAEQIKND